jgi:integrase/recombinase XerD
MDKNQLYVKITRDSPCGVSPYRLFDASGAGITGANGYLDSLAVRGLSVKTMRIYAYDLLNFWRWLRASGLELKDIVRASLFEYIRWQREDGTPSPATINHRLIVVKCIYEYHFDRRIPVGAHPVEESVTYFTPRAGYKRIGWMHPVRRKGLSTKVKVPFKIVVPLTHQEVADMFGSFRTWRDITMCGLMLFCGLRSKEVVSLTLNDINIYEEQFRVHGKGNKERLMPLPKNLIESLDRYMKLERPKTADNHLFVVLKGPRRGKGLTPFGLYRIFRYHRKVSGIHNANPHRFRHTFGANMTRAGISVPALMKLMGHSHVQTTMRYVNLFAEDIRAEFDRAISKLRTQEIINESRTKF